MPLVGDHQLEDRQLIAELVVSKMNQLLSRTPALSPQRALTTQQPQVSSCDGWESGSLVPWSSPFPELSQTQRPSQ